MKKGAGWAFVILFIFLGSCNSNKSWEEVKLENTLEAYSQFLEKNPETEHKDSLLMLIRGLEWIKAKSDNTLAALDTFRLKYPGNLEYDDSIKTLKERLVWKQAFEINTIESFEKFILENPKNQYCSDARSKIEGLRWIKAKKNNQKKEYLEFLADYTMGNYIDSIKIKFVFTDLIGFRAIFNSDKKTDGNRISETISLNFYTNKKMTGVFEGFQEQENYFAAWNGEINGNYDKDGNVILEKRTIGFSDVTDFEPEDWVPFNLTFDKGSFTFADEDRTYKFIEIDRISENED